MTTDTIFKRNILALSATNPLLSTYITQTDSSKNIKFINSRSGHIIPVIIRNGKEYPLHSTFDPAREGNRFLDLYPHEGCLVFLGIGAAYHILPFLHKKEISTILIIDKSVSMLKTILEQINLYHLLIDPRVKILIDGDKEQIEDYILSNYMPSLMGNLTSIPLLPRFNLEKEFFTLTMQVLEKMISKIADDYTVQASFGKKWFTNTLFNLEIAQSSIHTLSPRKKVIVTGAGPSLDDQITTLKKMRDDMFLIASDTSLPCLMNYGVLPDLVLSIDCQQVSYHHFLSGYPKGIPLLLDLASPPILTRTADKILFFSSGHPFSQYVSQQWRRFPHIDTSGGNVSHAAVSLAEKLGAEHIYLFGIDFSFPEGKAYARGTYLYNFFGAAETRIKNTESLFFSFIHKDKAISKEYNKNYIRYITKPMINYKERLESAITQLKAHVIALPGKGVAINVNPASRQNHTENNVNKLFAAGPNSSDWKEFLQSYLNGVKHLPRPTNPLVAYLSALTPREKDLWTTQLPAAADFRKHSLQHANDGALLLQNVRSWTIEKLQRRLKR
ncbi:MAG: DUF115 domain-containing protein [Spirochaetales bacterium]|nr:DUF115 domain-containing protein [Spirochaetales bacterium]